MRSLIIAAALFATPALAMPNAQFHNRIAQQGFPNQCFKGITCLQAPTRPDPMAAPKWWHIAPRKVA